MIPTVILTRPRAQSASFAAAIEAAWQGPVKIIQSPLLEIVAVAFDPGRPDAVIFTSTNGVAAATSHDLLQGLPAWCVGSKTAQAARAAGFDAIAGPGDAEGLVDDIIAAAPAGTLAHIRGTHARGGVSVKLSAAGLRCDDVVAYDQRALGLSSEAQACLRAKDQVIFPLFSPRTATILNEQGPFTCPLSVVVLSEAVKEAVRLPSAATIMVADEMTAHAMVKSVIAALERGNDCR